MMNHAMMATMQHQQMVNNWQHQESIRISQQMHQQHIQMHQQMMQHQQHSASASTSSTKRVTDPSRKSGLSVEMEIECDKTYIALQNKRPDNMTPKAYSYAMGERFFNELKNEQDQTKKLILRYILNQFVEDYKFWC